ncbi:MAG: TM1812 family CRISPR-associated protein [Candidatus Nitrosocaldus sp.]
MIIYQILGPTKYSEVEYEIEEEDKGKERYRCRLSSEALYKHYKNDKITKIVLLKPESVDDLSINETVEKVRDNTDGNVEIKTIQAVGTYNNTYYNGTPSNISLQIFVDMLRRKRVCEDMIIDLSTGYNLYVLSLLEAARFYTSYMRLYYADLSETEIFVRYAISEPVVRESSGPYNIYVEKLQTLTIFDLSLKRRELDSINLTSFIEDADKKDIGQRFSSLNNSVKRILRNLIIAYNAIRYNAPLFLFSGIDLGKEDENEDIVDQLCEFIDQIICDKKKIKREIYHKIFLSMAIRNGIWYILRDKLDYKSDRGVSLDTLESVFSSLYNNLKLDLNLRFLKKEIDEIKEQYKEYITNEWKTYKDIRGSALDRSLTNLNEYQSSSLSKKNVRSSDIKRNFFAHAGLSYDTLELRLDNEHILCRYRRDKINEIQQWIEDPDK